VSGVGQRGGEASEVIREHTFRMDGGHSPPYGLVIIFEMRSLEKMHNNILPRIRKSTSGPRCI